MIGASISVLAGVVVMVLSVGPIAIRRFPGGGLAGTGTPGGDPSPGTGAAPRARPAASLRIRFLEGRRWPPRLEEPILKSFTAELIILAPEFWLRANMPECRASFTACTRTRREAPIGNMARPERPTRHLVALVALACGARHAPASLRTPRDRDSLPSVERLDLANPMPLAE